MERMLMMLRSNAAILIAASALYLFALACAESPTVAGENTYVKPDEGRKTNQISKCDTLPHW